MVLSSKWFDERCYSELSKTMILKMTKCVADSVHQATDAMRYLVANREHLSSNRYRKVRRIFC